MLMQPGFFEADVRLHRSIYVFGYIYVVVMMTSYTCGILIFVWCRVVLWKTMEHPHSAPSVSQSFDMPVLQPSYFT